MLIDITPLRVSRDYRYLFFGQLISFFGSMMSFIVLSWQMLQLTGSNEMVGYIFLAQFVPMVSLAFIGGALADALDKRKMIRLTEIGQTFVTVILLINAFLPDPHIWVLYVAAALHAGLAALQRPAFESLIQKIVPDNLMSAVAALNSLRYNFGAIIGPSLAGIIVSQFKVNTVYAIDLVTFVASLIAVFAISAVPSPVNATRPSLKSIIEGCRYALSRQELLGTYLIDICAMFFAFPQALYPALAMMYGEKYLGLFPAALAIGMLVANFTSGWTKNIHKHGLMVAVAAVLWGVGIIFFGMASSIWVALFFLAAAGFFDMISGIFRMTIWNQTIPNYLRGRLASLEMISYLTGPMLGGAKMGIVAERFDVRTAIVSGGILCVIAVVVSSLFLPRFITYDGREGVKQREIEEAELAELARVSEGEF
ncbi:MAG TPA: MFS transporter [Pyrinomonadaceae bacterium]|nr:MFS transporter [Pyrinomonadaceae bacterium]